MVVEHMQTLGVEVGRGWASGGLLVPCCCIFSITAMP